MPAVWLQDQESGVNAGVTAAKEVKVKDAALGEIDDVAETDPEQDATGIALLKGLLTKLADPATQTTLAAVLAALTDGSLKATINGSLPVIWGATLDDRPAASSVECGQIFALANGALDMWISNGISWEEIE